jgi:ABC-type glycerol-3-phosphate transport system substrate-binding protein
MNRAPTLRILIGIAVIALVTTACGGASTSSAPSAAAATTPTAAPPSGEATTAPTAAPSLDTTPVTIKVWDYYGDSTPIKPALAGFKAAYPWVTVDYQALDWDSMNEKFKAGLGAGEVPDLATLDMTWIPTLAANGALDDLSGLSGGQLNGTAITDQYAQGALDAMSFEGKMVAMLYDFDTYSLYYRKDLFDKKGIAVPKNWDDFRAAAKSLAESSKPGGKPDKYLTAIRPNSFHFSQFLYQDGGKLLNDDNTAAVFNSPEGVAAVGIQKALLDDGSGKYWSDADGDLTPAIKSGEVAMFQDGPYYMGLLKTGVPEQSGKWAVATAPYIKEPGSYLGGTGLGIPVQATNKAAAWLLAQYLLRPDQQIGVFNYAGAAPATTAALQSPDLTKPDPYFGGEQPFGTFLESLKSSHPFPYVAAWDDIDTAIADAMQKALLGKSDAQAALDAAVAETNALLKK